MSAKSKNYCSPQQTGKKCCKHPEGSLKSYKAIVDAYEGRYKGPLTGLLGKFKKEKYVNAVG